jgi:hypothetical protein
MGASENQDRISWLDDEGGVAIDDYARRLESFMQAMADGVVSADEVAEQEKRVADLMREIEPTLDDELHGRVTELLCELTAFDIMQMLHAMHEARSQVKFRG